MIPIIIDTSDVSKELNLSKENIEGLIEYTIKEVTSAFYEKWVSLANKTLKSTRDQYVRSIYIGDQGRFVGYVALRGVFPNMLEQGAEAWDMKKGFSQSNKRKIKLNGSGWYITIPFRFASSGAIGESSAFAGIMPTNVYNIIKKKESTSAGAIQSIKTNELPKELQIPTTRAAIILKSKKFDEYTHKTSIYAGIGKSSKTYEGATQSGYVSFRRVSDKSDESSWIHPSISPMNLSGKALESMDLRQIVDYASNEFYNTL